MRPELQIRNVRLVDGSGAPARPGCLDISGGRIAAVGGPERPACRVLDGGGAVACPGFIDAHNHADLAAGSPEEMACMLYQGVTTCVVGNCGFSAFPAWGEAGRSYLRYAAGVMGKPRGFSGAADLYEYGQRLNGASMLVNLASHVGHGMLRAAALGAGDAPADRQGLERMCRLLDALLEQGAAGLSLGLIYSPGARAGWDELAALARTAARRGKPVAVHLRDEGRGLEDSVEEMLSLARETGVHIHFSHHKVMGAAFHGSSARSLALLDRARTSGLEVSLDAYPYDAGCSTALVLLPPWVLAQGMEEALARLERREVRSRIQADLERGIEGWENLVGSCGWKRLEIAALGSGDPALQGKSLAQLGQIWGISPLEALARLLVQEGGNVSITIRGMCQEDVDRILTWPDTLLGSDGLFAKGSAHPRRYGAFPRFLHSYVMQRGLISLEEAVAKMTGRTASCFGLRGRGLLRPGYWADVVLFHPEALVDRADYAEPERLAAGIEHVFVAGVHTLDSGRPTGQYAGRLLTIKSGENRT